MNYKELYLSTKKLSEKRTETNSMASNVRLMKTENDHTLYTFEAKSKSGPDIYKQVIEKKNDLPGLRNQIINNEIELAVSCTCLDFVHTFAHANYNKKCLYGPKPPDYQKITDRPLRNPLSLPGICTHLFGAFRLSLGNL